MMKVHYGAQYVERMSLFVFGFTPGRVYRIEEWENSDWFVVRNDMGERSHYTTDYKDGKGRYVWQDAWIKNLKNILEE